MSPRIIRRQSLWSKLTSYPLDALLELNELRESIDWDIYSTTVALPLGFTLTILYFILRLWDDYNIVETSSSRQNSHFNYDYDLLKDSKYFNQRNDSFGINGFFGSVKLLIISINVINTIRFLFKTRTYSIFNKDKLFGNSENAVKITKENQNQNVFIKFIRSNFFKNDYDNNDEDIESYWELRVWNPSKFSTHLFVSFPPFNILFLYLSQSSFINLIFLFITSSILYFVIIRGYLVLLNDKQVLYQETFDEYQRKFIRPKLSVSTREVAVDATRGPYSNSHNSVEIYSPHLTEKIFKYHDFKGNESVEKFDSGEFTPLKRKSIAYNIEKNPALGSIRRQTLATPRETRYSSYQPSPLARKTYK